VVRDTVKGATPLQYVRSLVVDEERMSLRQAVVRVGALCSLQCFETDGYVAGKISGL